MNHFLSDKVRAIADQSKTDDRHTLHHAANELDGLDNISNDFFTIYNIIVRHLIKDGYISGDLDD